MANRKQARKNEGGKRRIQTNKVEMKIEKECKI